MESLESLPMKISEMLLQGKPTISFEFFPPKTEEGFQSLMKTIGELRPLKPSFVSLTYGAGGSTRQATLSLVPRIKQEINIEAAAHLTCVGHSQAEIKAVLVDLKRAGIDNIIALRGDPPKGETVFRPNPDGFRYASELVGFIRKNFDFAIGVAGYPEKHIEAPSIDVDLGHLKEKVVAGADFIITQLFFRNEDYFQFIGRLKSLGIHVPVIAGIMPITDVAQITRFAQRCGARIPDDLRVRLERAEGNRDEVVRLGIEHALEQSRELLKSHVPGIHFYTLNRSHSTQEIVSRLKKEDYFK